MDDQHIPQILMKAKATRISHFLKRMYFNFVYLENTDLNCSYINSWTGNLFCGFVLFAIPQFFVSASVSIVALTEEGF